jgi:hypothetical protein
MFSPPFLMNYSNFGKSHAISVINDLRILRVCHRARGMYRYANFGKRVSRRMRDGISNDTPTREAAIRHLRDRGLPIGPGEGAAYARMNG